MSFNTIRSYTLSVFTFIVVVFFLPSLQDYVTTAKWFLVGFVALALLLSSVGEFLFSKKITWEARDLDTPLTLFIVAGTLSILFGSMNKIQALLNPHFGLLTFVFLFILYFYISRSQRNSSFEADIFSLFAVLVSISFLICTVPFFTSRLPSFLVPFKNITFVGSLIDAVLFSGFSSIFALSYLLKKKESQREALIHFFGFTVSTITFAVLTFTLVKNSTSLVLPSAAHSWYAAVEVLKKPMTALFGGGIDNYSQLFIQVKDSAYNASSLWQIPTFSLARTALFHILAETGIVGTTALFLVFSLLFHKAFAPSGTITAKLITLYFAAAFILFPPSFLLFFLFFLWLARESMQEKKAKHTIDFGDIVPGYALIVLAGMVSIGGMTLLLGRIFMSEYTFRQSLTTSNLKDVYEKMRQAAQYNPYNERIRGNFVQAHLLIANTVASKATKNEKGEPQLSETDRQTVSKAIQAAIDEAKAVVSLNPNRASNWELLATVYRSITGVVQGADTWTVSAYQRAIILDPQNPSYRVALGSTLYGYKQYEDATRMFEQAVSIKPEWPNAQYNYAWALFQKGDYQKAASAMQTCVSLLNPRKDAADLKKATADLAEFKQKIPAEEQQKENTQTDTNQQKESLSLPPSPAPHMEQKIELPKTASPEAK